MNSLFLSPESAAKFFMLDQEKLARAKRNATRTYDIYFALEADIERIAANRNLLTEEELSNLAPIIDLSGLIRRYSQKANFGHCILNHAVFNEQVIDVCFHKTQLCDANFSGGYLGDVSFKDADLTRASFKKAELHNVDFTGADLSGADFTGVRNEYRSPLNFTGAKNLDKAIGLLPEIVAAARRAAFGATRAQPAASGANGPS